MDLRLGMAGQRGRRRAIQRPTWAGEPGDQKPGWEAAGPGARLGGHPLQPAL